jgi:hypothetical protein
MVLLHYVQTSFDCCYGHGQSRLRSGHQKQRVLLQGVPLRVKGSVDYLSGLSLLDAAINQRLPGLKLL